jgi:phosphoglycerol transferase MdoB-like AlkP superfamily enzyme
MNKHFRLFLSTGILAIFAAVFLLARLALYFVGAEFFKDLSATDLLYSFAQGIRFDLLIICMFCGIFFLFINIPVNSKKWIKINLTILSCLLFAFLLFLTGDIIYFAQFQKHLTTELLLATNHISFLLSLAFKDYILAVLLIIALFAAVQYVSLKIADKYYTSPNKNIAYNIILYIVMIFVLFFFIRGRLQGKNLAIIDAYTKGSRAAGELVLNGAFTSFTNLRKMQVPNKIDMTDETALKLVQANLINPQEEIIPDPKFPLMRERIKFSVDGKNYNVVVLLLESWQKEYIDSLVGTNYGVTPNFDALAKNAVIYDNFYANGQRSIMGLTSIFLSMPHVQGLNYIGYGIENIGQTRLPLILAKNGYDNVFVQGDKRESDKAIFFANWLGFKNSYGKQDIPVTRKYDVLINKGYDIEAFEFFFDKLQGLKTPFFGFFFTSTTHIPYAKTILKELEKYPEDGTEITGYLNRLYYADWALGKFFEAARKEPWFDNTIFIMLSDHQAYTVGGKKGVYETEEVNKVFRAPMILYCPKLFKPEIKNIVASQFDIVPTIIDALNISSPYSSFGKSLISPDTNRWAFLSYEGQRTYLVTPSGWIKRNWSNPSEPFDFSHTDADLLLAIERTIYNLQKSDTWFDSKTLN